MKDKRWSDETAERYTRTMSPVEKWIIGALVVILLVALLSFLAKGGGASIPWMS